LFDGMAKRDAAAIKKPLLSGGTMVLMRDGKPTQMTFEDFANRLGKPGTTQIQERIVQRCPCGWSMGHCQRRRHRTQRLR
jgi:hypothetical protein